LQAQAPHAEERRREGGTLHIQCPYTDETYQQHWKLWCLLKDERCYEPSIRTSYQYTSHSRDRITIKDDPTAKTVSVTMADLTAQDSGKYLCAVYYASGYPPVQSTKTISLNVFKGECHCTCFGISPNILDVFQGPSSTQPRSQAMSLSNVNIFMLLSVILSILLILALITLVMLSVRLHKLLKRTGNGGAEDTYDNSEGTAQLGSTERRESSKDDSKGLKHINLDLQSQPSPQDPLYCNIEASQARRNPHGENVEYAVIAFNQFPRNDAG
ncbi:TRML2 protein, partial [Tachuris rubrigastra]|nr:TRML2 protein [Tachuris rubrigastra]